MTSRRGFTWIELCVVIAIIVVLMALIGAPFAIQFVFYTVVYGLLGWYWFLERTLPEVEWYAPGLGLGLVSLLLFAGILHVALRRWRQSSQLTNAGGGLAAWTWRRTASLVGLVLLFFTAGTAVVGETHEVIWSWRSNERFFEIASGRQIALRSQSRNNLKQMGLALHTYHDIDSRFPAGGQLDVEGRQLHGWMADLLPYVDQAALARRIRRELPWRAPENREVYQTLLPMYQNPKLFREGHVKTAEGYPVAHYAGNLWLFANSTGPEIQDIADGTSNTIMTGEVAGEFRAWGDAANWRDPALGINRTPTGFGSSFPGGAHLLFCDGTVRFLNEKVDPAVLRALATPAGGEKVDPMDF